VAYHLKRLETAGLVLPASGLGVRLTPLGDKPAAESSRRATTQAAPEARQERLSVRCGGTCRFVRSAEVLLEHPGQILRHLGGGLAGVLAESKAHDPASSR